MGRRSLPDISERSNDFAPKAANDSQWVVSPRPELHRLMAWGLEGLKGRDLLMLGNGLCSPFVLIAAAMHFSPDMHLQSSLETPGAIIRQAGECDTRNTHFCVLSAARLHKLQPGGHASRSFS